jgi:hypothetical protein
MIKGLHARPTPFLLGLKRCRKPSITHECIMAVLAWVDTEYAPQSGEVENCAEHLLPEFKPFLSGLN